MDQSPPDRSLYRSSRAFEVLAAAARDRSLRAPPRPGAVVLARRYDADKLREDYAAVAGRTHRQQPGVYHSGGWRGLSLVAPGGRADWAGACLPIGERPAKTPLLACTPYMEQLLDALPCEVVSARLLALLPGERIETHCDELMDLSAGMARLHVPVVTHPDVEFVVSGVRYALSPGDLWYAEFTRPHSVANPTTTSRIHLVIDAFVSEALLSLFPLSYLASLRGDEICVAQGTVAGADLHLPDERRRFAVPAFAREPLQNLRSLANAARKDERVEVRVGSPEGGELYLSFRRGERGPVLEVDGQPFAALDVLGGERNEHFRMLGLPPCITGRFQGAGLEFFFKGQRVARLEPTEGD